MLVFDEATRQLLEKGYGGPDVKARRRANIDALDPASGEHIVDIGAGAGHLASELAPLVGETGSVIAVEPSAAMRTAAADLCDGLKAVSVVDGTATALPLADACVDGAVSVQVFEYLSDDDVRAALCEIRRVLRPGGRVVIGDIHWDSLIWRTADPSRFARIIAAYDSHLADRRIPEWLHEAMTEEGFEAISVTPQTTVDRTFREDSLAFLTATLMLNFVTNAGLIKPADAQGFREEQFQFARDGRFFFSTTHFVTAARTP